MEEAVIVSAVRTPVGSFVFRQDGGTVTAGNASPVNDGAAALIVRNGVSAHARGDGGAVR